MRAGVSLLLAVCVRAPKRVACLTGHGVCDVCICECLARGGVCVLSVCVVCMFVCACAVVVVFVCCVFV